MCHTPPKMPIYWLGVHYTHNVWRHFLLSWMGWSSVLGFVFRASWCSVFVGHSWWDVLGLCDTLGCWPYGDFAGWSILLTTVTPPFFISVLACLPSIYWYVLSASVFCALIWNGIEHVLKLTWYQSWGEDKAQFVLKSNLRSIDPTSATHPQEHHS